MQPSTTKQIFDIYKYTSKGDPTSGQKAFKKKDKKFFEHLWRKSQIHPDPQMTYFITNQSVFFAYRGTINWEKI